jgi:hypothetical protein
MWLNKQATFTKKLIPAFLKRGKISYNISDNVSAAFESPRLFAIIPPSIFNKE